ncbi:MAG: pseudouridine synthase [Actinomycetota bacterium]
MPQRRGQSIPPAEQGVSGIRLQKVLSQAGLASRRGAEEMIRAGRIRVDGHIASLGERVDPAQAVVEVDGRRVPVNAERRYLALNKPAGVITTQRDPQGRRTVLDIVGEPERIFPVGRLDAETEGLLLLTNDGELAFRLTHPSFEIPKTYIVEVEGEAGRGTIARLQEGVRIEGERPAKADSVRIVDRQRGRDARSVLEITLHEGRKHVVRRMLATLGHPVVRLVRTAVGPVRLGRLAPGTYRKLTSQEVQALHEAAGL